MRTKRIVSAVLLACLAMSPAVLAAGSSATRQISTTPSVDLRFSDYDMAIRSNRNAMLNNNECASVTVQSSPSTVIGIGNVYVQGAPTGPIVNQTEIHNSTIIIQNK